MPEDLGKQIDDLHHEMFNSSSLGNHTDLWNAVYEFKEKVKKIVAPRADEEPTLDKEV